MLSRDHNGPYVEHPERRKRIPARLECNSLVMDVQVCAVRADEVEDDLVMVVHGAPQNDEMPKENEVAANDIATRENEVPENEEKPAAESSKVDCSHEAIEGDRGVKRAAEQEDGEMLALTQELSEQVPQPGGCRPADEAPMKRSKTLEAEDMELRSPGYTTEESGDVLVEASSSEDGKVQSRMARWMNWKLKHGAVKTEPVELSDGPDMEVEAEENHVFPVRGEGRALHGYISRELALLEKVPGWHALPNGIVVHPSPQATHFLDPSLSFGEEWCGRCVN